MPLKTENCKTQLFRVFDNLGHKFSLGYNLLANKGIALHHCRATADGCHQRQVENERVAWNDLVAELDIVNLQEIGRVVFGIINIAQYQNAAHLGHCLDLQHARHDGLIGEVALEERFISRHVLDAYHVFLTFLDDFVNQEHRVAMRQHLAYLVDVIEWLLVGIIDGSLNILISQLLTYLFGQLGVERVAWACGDDASL